MDKYELLTKRVDIGDLDDGTKLQQIGFDIMELAEIISEGEDGVHLPADIKSMTPVYNDESEIIKLMIMFEKKDYLVVNFNDDDDDEYAYPIEYLPIFKVGNKIKIEGATETIKDIVYNPQKGFIELSITT